ncbi:MAG: DMT family transporter [Patescibacteria group bacterium]
MNKAHLAILISVVIWASTFAATKIVLVEIAPITLAFLRFLIASVILVIAVWLTKQSKQLKNAFKQDTPFFLLLGLTGIALMFILENFAIKFTSTSEAAIIMNSDPILIAILAYFFISEKFNKYKVLGILLGFVGVLIVIFNKTDFASLIKTQSFLGNMLALTSSFAWAIYTIMIKKRVDKYGPTIVTTIASIFGAIFLLIAMFLFEGLPNFGSYTMNSWLLVLYLGVIVSGLSFFLWNYALKHFEASKVGMYWFLVPVIAVIIGILLFKEELTTQMIIGTLLIFTGIYLTEKKATGANST